MNNSFGETRDIYFKKKEKIKERKRKEKREIWLKMKGVCAFHIAR